MRPLLRITVPPLAAVILWAAGARRPAPPTAYCNEPLQVVTAHGSTAANVDQELSAKPVFFTGDPVDLRGLDPYVFGAEPRVKGPFSD